MKKKLFLVFIFLMIPLNIFAEEKSTFSLNEVAASPGNNVTIKLNVENNPEFGILAVKLHYDIEKLEYISSEIKGMKNALLKDAESNDKGMIALYAITLDKKKLMDDTGTLLVLEFKIKDDVKEDCAIKLEVTDFGKDENTPIEFDSIDGNIKIKNDIESITIDDDVSLNDNIDEEKEVIWESSDEEIAAVDDDGNVEFKEDGNVTIRAKDKDDEETIYEKDYYVKDKVKKKNNKDNNYILIAVGLILLIIVGIVIFKKIRKKKCLNPRKN